MSKFKKIYCKVSIIFAVIAVALCLSLMVVTPVYATEYGPTENAPNASDTSTGGSGFSLTFDGDTGSLSSSVEIILILTVLALAPTILIMFTSFTRIIVVLHFIRIAIGTQTSPPNQVIIGLALFLTLFIMWPTITTINVWSDANKGFGFIL